MPSNPQKQNYPNQIYFFQRQPKDKIQNSLSYKSKTKVDHWKN